MLHTKNVGHKLQIVKADDVICNLHVLYFIQLISVSQDIFMSNISVMLQVLYHDVVLLIMCTNLLFHLCLEIYHN